MKQIGILIIISVLFLGVFAVKTVDACGWWMGCPIGQSEKIQEPPNYPLKITLDFTVTVNGKQFNPEKQDFLFVEYKNCDSDSLNECSEYSIRARSKNVNYDKPSEKFTIYPLTGRVYGFIMGGYSPVIVDLPFGSVSHFEEIGFFGKSRQREDLKEYQVAIKDKPMLMVS
ncbi:hypothetical protein J4401_06770 [Candidatus Woesearchaeota archaeon]|nr:hypothetical protein [Candidatus Woesearchaeota archaeon]